MDDEHGSSDPTWSSWPAEQIKQMEGLAWEFASALARSDGGASGFARRRLPQIWGNLAGSRESAEDLVQDAFVRAIESFDPDHRVQFKSFFHTCLVSAAMDHGRRSLVASRVDEEPVWWECTPEQKEALRIQVQSRTGEQLPRYASALRKHLARLRDEALLVTLLDCPYPFRIRDLLQPSLRRRTRTDVFEQPGLDASLLHKSATTRTCTLRYDAKAGLFERCDPTGDCIEVHDPGPSSRRLLHAYLAARGPSAEEEGAPLFATHAGNALDPADAMNTISSAISRANVRLNGREICFKTRTRLPLVRFDDASIVPSDMNLSPLHSRGLMQAFRLYEHLPARTRAILVHRYLKDVPWERLAARFGHQSADSARITLRAVLREFQHSIPPEALKSAQEVVLALEDNEDLRRLAQRVLQLLVVEAGETDEH